MASVVRRFLAALLGLMLAIIGSAAFADALAPLPVEEIAPGVFAHTGDIAMMSEANEGDIANIGFVVGDRGVAVVDAGGSVRVGQRLLAAIRARTQKPILYVVNTHEHPDHVFGDAAFSGLGATFVGHVNLPRSLAARGAFYLKAFRRISATRPSTRSRIVPPTLLVDDRLTLDLGGRSSGLAGVAARAHGLRLTVLDTKTRTLLPATSCLSATFRSSTESLRGWLAIFPALAAIPADRVVPGHGPPPSPLAPGARKASAPISSGLAEEVKGFHSPRRASDSAAKAAGQSLRDGWRLFDDYKRAQRDDGLFRIRVGSIRRRSS